MNKKICQQCNQVFYKRLCCSKKRWEVAKFCSHPCYAKSITIKREEKKCIQCGILFSGYSQRKCCSLKCSHLASIGRKNPHSPEQIIKAVATRMVRGSYKKGFGKGRTEQGKINNNLSKKNWKLNHPEIVNFHTRIRKYRLRGADGVHTFSEWLDLKKFYNYMCLCCKKSEPEIRLTEDHIVPITVWGEWIKEHPEIKYKCDDIENIQPLCRSCNSIKFQSIINFITIQNASYNSILK